MKKGLLLINLGTPKSPTVSDVRLYLREFLSDPRVIDLPTIARYILLYGVILPFRPKKTAKAYQSIWTSTGSPLLVNSLLLTDKLKNYLGDSYEIALGMRYGQPTLTQALKLLSDCSDITVLPLYPQYSSAATGSSIEACLKKIAVKNSHPNLKIIRDFFQNPAFIAAQAEIINPFLSHHDYLLFSYHGLPERHLKQTGCLSVCEIECPLPTLKNQTCYKAQCTATTQALANKLNLSADKFSMSFQSRLGRTPWIKPYTDLVLPELAKKGIKRLAIACPSFVADCLETLEEIGLRAKEQWLELGGEELTLVPCVNASDNWIKAIVEIAEL